MQAQMRERTTRRIYNVQSYFYDRLLANMLRRRQGNAIRRMKIGPGETVLDIGIGTGVSLELYPQDCRVVGIDISEGMLGKAQERIRSGRWDGASLVLADAMFMPFADNTFDHILISHVITVVSDPIRLVENIKRVGKPGCRIVIINHFQSGHRTFAWLERVLSPVCVHLGWRSDLNLHELLKDTDLEVDFRYKTKNFDLWEIVFLRNSTPRLISYDCAMQASPPANSDWRFSPASTSSQPAATVPLHRP